MGARACAVAARAKAGCSKAVSSGCRDAAMERCCLWRGRLRTDRVEDRQEAGLESVCGHEKRGRTVDAVSQMLHRLQGSGSAEDAAAALASGGDGCGQKMKCDCLQRFESVESGCAGTHS